MYQIGNDFPNKMIFEEGGPCISLYQKTHRYPPDNHEDMIVYKHLVQQLEKALTRKYPDVDAEAIMKPFYELKDDRAFWEHTPDGIAILANKATCVIYLLSGAVENLAVVADDFRVLPLLAYAQSSARYCLLGISSGSFSMFEGNQYEMKEMPISPDIARNIDDVLGKEHPEGFLNHGRYGGSDGVAMFHGHGGRKDAIDKDLEKFFRYVDKTVLENFAKPMKLPLILVSLEEHQSAFRKLSNNPYLVEEGIETSYESLDLNQLARLSWELMAPRSLAKTLATVERYKIAKANHTGSDDVEEVVRAAYEGRVDTIFIEANKSIPGRFDVLSESMECGSADDFDCGDIIDAIVKAVMKNNGEVIVLPEEKMPSDTGVASIFRF